MISDVYATPGGDFVAVGFTIKKDGRHFLQYIKDSKVEEVRLGFPAESAHAVPFHAVCSGRLKNGTLCVRATADMERKTPLLMKSQDLAIPGVLVVPGDVSSWSEMRPRVEVFRSTFLPSAFLRLHGKSPLTIEVPFFSSSSPGVFAIDFMSARNAEGFGMVYKAHQVGESELAKQYRTKELL